MMYHRISLAALLSFSILALAQSPMNPPAETKTTPEQATKADQYLNAYLKAWEQRMSGLKSLETKVTMTETVVENKQREATVYEGEAAILRPNYAKLFMKDKANPTNQKKWKHFVADGKYLWDYDYAAKIVRVYEQPKDGIGDNTLMNFLFGMKAPDIRRRYEMLMEPDNPKKMTEWYAHIQILPKSDADKQEFKNAELVLIHNRNEKYKDLLMLPARLWFQNVNGNEITWEFQKMNIQAQLLEKDFAAPAIPKDWKSEWGAPPKPTTVRGTGLPKK